MNVLVTGAAGFVGGHLVKELHDNGHNVIAAVNNNETPPINATAVKADLYNEEQVTNNIDFTNIDAVIHLAGLAAVGPSFDEPRKYMDVNTTLQLNLYNACIAQKAEPKFLIISSGTLYDPTSQMPINEDSPVLPTSPYAASKVAQEALAQCFGNRFDYVIARPMNHIGPGQNPGFIVPDFAQQIVQAERGERTEIQVGNLDARRDYTDVRDIVRAYRLLVEADAKNQTYNICTGNSVSGKEILDLLLAKSMARLAITQDPARMRPSDIPEIYGDYSKLSSDTGWQPTYGLEQTLQDALDDWRAR